MSIIIDNITYSYSGNTAIVTSGSTLLVNVVIPETITVDSTIYNVQSIANNAFRVSNNGYNYNLISISIPSSVKSIGNTVFFQCTALKSVTFGENSLLTTIGTSIFNSCTNLPSIVIPNGLTSIGKNAFYNCASLTSIVIPTSVTTIVDGTAFNLSGLTTVFINSPNGLNITSPSNGTVTFYGKSGVTILLDLPIKETYTSNNVNYSYTVGSGIATVISSPNASGDVTILDIFSINKTTIYNVQSIGDNAFSSCSSLNKYFNFGILKLCSPLGPYNFYFFIF